ncbi:hypothetical protein [Streptomyces sp. NPDC007205]|uniref:tetratricopeptide repeat protein n=1 Tax=Streptomyces sp. NPDC007205 TaxID=3154316 RepID=UPI0033F704F5
MDILDIAAADREDPVQQLLVLAGLDADPARRPPLLDLIYRQIPVDTKEDAALLASTAGAYVTATAEEFGRQRSVTVEAQLLYAMIDSFASYKEQFGGGHARAVPAAYTADDVGRLLTSLVRPPVRTDVMIAVGQLAHLMGDMTADAGHHGLAQRYYLLASGIAVKEGDRRGRAIALRAMSVQAASLEVPRYAADLADAAVDVAGTLDDGDLRAFLLAQRAYARTLVRDAPGAIEDLAAAERALDGTTGGAGPFTSYPRAGLAYQQGMTLHALGDRAGAVAAFSRAVQWRAPHERRLRALTQARLADVLLDLGRVEEACVHASAFADDYPFLHSHGAILAIGRIRSRFATFLKVQRAAAVYERLTELEEALRSRVGQ